MNSLANYFQGKSIQGYVFISDALHKFKHDQRGVTAVEYAIVAAGVGGVVAVAFGETGTFTTMLNAIFTSLRKTVETNILPKT